MNSKAPSPQSAKWQTPALLLLSIVAVGAALVSPFLASKAPEPLFAALILFSLLHGAVRYGVKSLIVFIVICVVVSNIFENMSIMMGFPFGHYHYNGGGKLFHVPVQVGAFYFAIGYSSWQLASILLDGADAQLQRRVNVWALPVVAAFVMTMFDVAADPTASTVQKTWTWHHGGGLFGVPYTNFLGWFLTTWTFFQLFALYLAGRPKVVRPAAPRGFFLAPVFGYASLGLYSVATFVGNQATGSVVDQTGASWQLAHLYETGMIFAIFSVLAVATLALVKVVRGDIREVSR